MKQHRSGSAPEGVTLRSRMAVQAAHVGVRAGVTHSGLVEGSPAIDSDVNRSQILPSRGVAHEST